MTKIIKESGNRGSAIEIVFFASIKEAVEDYRLTQGARCPYEGRLTTPEELGERLEKLQPGQIERIYLWNDSMSFLQYTLNAHTE